MAIDLKEQIREIGIKARKASSVLANTATEKKNHALEAAATSIRKNKNNILKANEMDLKEASSQSSTGDHLSPECGVSKAFLDRLKLDDKRIESMARGLEEIAALADPVGKELVRWKRPNGLDIARVSVPLGVIGIIYEARPNVTADAAGLCIKSGNAVILRGGSESFNSSKAILECIREGILAAGLPEDSAQLIPTRNREAVGEMLKSNEYIDVIIPRGGKGLTKRIMEESRVPTLLHLDGNCHTYIHEDADREKALKILLNAKMRRTGICGATESLVIDEKIARRLLPEITNMLTKELCELRGDEKSCKIDKRINPATEEDFYTEYLDAIISVKIVNGVEEAIDFVNKYGSHHTEAIITENKEAAEKFLRKVESAIVMHNASTQFADGGEFGMGAEIGIATGKLHARGPVGVEQLTTFKYMVRGNGAVRGN